MSAVNRVEPGYNVIGLYDTSPKTSDILGSSSSLVTTTLHSSIRKTFVYHFNEVKNELEHIRERIKYIQQISSRRPTCNIALANLQIYSLTNNQNAMCRRPTRCTILINNFYSTVFFLLTRSSSGALHHVVWYIRADESSC